MEEEGSFIDRVFFHTIIIIILTVSRILIFGLLGTIVTRFWPGITRRQLFWLRLHKLFLFLRIELFNLIRKYFLIGNIIHSLIGNKYDIIIIDIILYDFFFKLITRCTTTRRGIKRECGIIINHEVIYCFEMRLIE